MVSEFSLGLLLFKNIIHTQWNSIQKILLTFEARRNNHFPNQFAIFLNKKIISYQWCGITSDSWERARITCWELPDPLQRDISLDYRVANSSKKSIFLKLSFLSKLTKENGKSGWTFSLKSNNILKYWPSLPFFLRKPRLKKNMELNTHVYRLVLVNAWYWMLISLLVQNLTNKFGVMFVDKQVLSIVT